MNNKAAEINQKSTNYRKGFYGREAELANILRKKKSNNNVQINPRKRKA